MFTIYYTSPTTNAWVFHGNYSTAMDCAREARCLHEMGYKLEIASPDDKPVSDEV